MTITKNKESLNQFFNETGFIVKSEPDFNENEWWYLVSPSKDIIHVRVKITDKNIIFRGNKKGMIICMIPLNKEMIMDDYEKDITKVKEYCRKTDNINSSFKKRSGIESTLRQLSMEYGVHIDTSYNELDNAGIRIFGRHENVMAKQPLYFEIYINKDDKIIKEYSLDKYNHIVERIKQHFL